MGTRRTPFPAALWFLGRSDAEVYLAALLLALPVAIGLLVLHLFSTEADHPLLWASVVGLIAAAAFALVFSRIAAYFAEQRRRMEMQANAISEINQRIQRALDVVRMAPQSAFDQQIVGSISQNVSRIEMAASSMLNMTNGIRRSGAVSQIHVKPTRRFA